MAEGTVWRKCGGEGGQSERCFCGRNGASPARDYISQHSFSSIPYIKVVVLNASRNDRYHMSQLGRGFQDLRTELSAFFTEHHFYLKE